MKVNTGLAKTAEKSANAPARESASALSVFSLTLSRLPAGWTLGGVGDASAGAGLMGLMMMAIVWFGFGFGWLVVGGGLRMRSCTGQPLF